MTQLRRWDTVLRLGFHCSLSCANLTAILLVGGVMDLRMMALVTTAEPVAKATGIGMIATAPVLAAGNLGCMKGALAPGLGLMSDLP
jgi:predicted metal-binding membrane protein